jgi:hypothetical protein
MDLDPSLDEVAAKLAEACEECAIEYALIGGLAAGAHGSGRPTEDVDAVVSLSPADAEGIDRLLNALKARGFRINVDALNRRAKRGHTILFLWIARVRLDVMLQKPDGYWADALKFRQRGRVEKRELWVAAAEDIVALKLAAGREKDLEAIRSILQKKYRSLDLPRLRALAQRLSAKVPELPARLEALLAEADELNRLADLPPED